MNRAAIIEAILKDSRSQEFKTALTYLSDTNLICLAQDLGVDTDKILLDDQLKMGQQIGDAVGEMVFGKKS